MELKFFLISNNARLEINEPIGFDRFEPEIKRNDMHGASVEFSDVDLEFSDCDAVALIQSKYEASIDSEIDFVVELFCRKNVNDIEAFTEIYRGRLDLGTYQFLKKKYTSVKCKVGQVGVLTTFNNRISTDVCVDNPVSLGEVELSDYSKIDMVVSVPGKTIIAVSKCNDIAYEEYLPTPFNFISGADMSVIYVPGMANSDGGDLGFFNYSNATTYNASSQSELKPFFELKDNGIEAPDSNFTCTLRFKLRVEANNNVFTGTKFNPNAVLEIYDENGKSIANKTDNTPNPVITGDNYTEYSYFGNVSFSNIKVKKIFIRILFRLYVPGLLTDEGLSSYVMKSLPAVSNFEIKTYSIMPASNAKISLIHETLSRVSECITDGELKVISGYYGRVDSEVNSPVSYQHNGVGALRGLTNGYKLRNYVYTDGSLPRMYISMKKLIQSLSAIDNIGCGFYWAVGRWWLRVENWKWFYQDVELFKIENAANVERVHHLDETFTRLKVGYKKYADVGEANVVDTFHSERNFSTYAKAVDKEVNVLSDFVADPYVIEYTRRKSLEKDTKDWQYDEDAFILCLMRCFITETGPNGQTSYVKYEVDNGMEETGNTVISPETMMNVYISPVRNANRWADRFSQYPGANYLSYTSGSRNTKAKGKALSRGSKTESINGGTTTRTTEYTQARDSYSVVENGVIEKETAKLKSQILRFDYPITLEQFNAIRTNPYGYILVDGERCWISSIKYGFKTGLTKFELIPEWK